MDTMESLINQAKIDYTFKILLVGDSGVGKSSILLRFTSDIFDDRPQTVGVDFKAKFMTLKDKGLKVTIWDTAGQEKFRTLTASYYRSAHGIILVYDVTNRETFINLSDVWLKEVDIYSTNQDCIKMLVGNKVDRVQDMVLLWDRKNEKPGKHKKFDSLWLGPYIIQDIVRPNSFHLSRLDGEPLDLPANGQMLKLFFKDNI